MAQQETVGRTPIKAHTKQMDGRRDQLHPCVCSIEAQENFKRLSREGPDCKDIGEISRRDDNR